MKAEDFGKSNHFKYHHPPKMSDLFVWGCDFVAVHHIPHVVGHIVKYLALLGFGVTFFNPAMACECG